MNLNESNEKLNMNPTLQESDEKVDRNEDDERKESQINLNVNFSNIKKLMQ